MKNLSQIPPSPALSASPSPRARFLIPATLVLAPSLAGADTLGVIDWSGAGGSLGAYSKTKVSVFVEQVKFINSLKLTESDIGKTFVFDSGPEFCEATALLTNGVSDEFHIFTGLVGGGGGGTISSEANFFDFDFPGANGIDFFGTHIDRIELHLEYLNIVVSNGPSGPWTDHEYEYTITVFGSVGSGVASSEVVRLGLPANPMAFLPGLSSGPVTGATWDPVIDHTTFFPDALADAALVTVAPLNLELPGLGTLLCDLSSPTFGFATAPGTPFEIPIPDNCGLIGLPLSSQGVSSDGVDNLLTNALDITIGTY